MNATNANKDEIEARLNAQQRKTDAKIRMKHAYKVMNGEFQNNIANDSYVAMPNCKKKNANNSNH